MKPRASLETDMESSRPQVEILPGLGMAKSILFFIFSYVVLSSVMKHGIGGLQTVFLGLVAIGTFYIFLTKYDSDDVEAYSFYLLNSLYFWFFSKGEKKLNVVKDVRGDFFVLQNGGLRAVIEVFSSKELSNESHESVEQLISNYSRFLETFGQYFQLVVRIRKLSPKELVMNSFGNTESPAAMEYLEQFGRHGVASLKIYIVMAVDPAKWYEFEKKDEEKLEKTLEEKVTSCMGFLSRTDFVSEYRRLTGDELLDFCFDENFYQRKSGKEKSPSKTPINWMDVWGNLSNLMFLLYFFSVIAFFAVRMSSVLFEDLNLKFGVSFPLLYSMTYFSLLIPFLLAAFYFKFDSKKFNQAKKRSWSTALLAYLGEIGNGETLLIGLPAYVLASIVSQLTRPLKPHADSLITLLGEYLTVIIKDMREFFQVPESDIHPSLRTVGDFYVTKDRIYCNGVYAKNLLLKYLPERDPSLMVKELLTLNLNLDISFHLYPDQGKKIRKILGSYYRTLSDQMDDMRQKGNVSLTSIYQEKQLKETYFDSLGGRNLFLATTLITVYDYSPKRLKAGIELVKKALRPAGLITDSLTFNQERAFLSSIPFGTDRIQKFTAIDVEKLAEGTMPFVEHSLDIGKAGIPIGVELKEGI